MNRVKNKEKKEGPIQGFILGQLAAMSFAVPTAVLLWFATNKHLALWGPNKAFIGSNVFWVIILFFALVSIFLPRLFPSLLSKVWHGIIKTENWL